MAANAKAMFEQKVAEANPGLGFVQRVGLFFWTLPTYRPGVCRQRPEFQAGMEKHW